MIKKSNNVPLIPLLVVTMILVNLVIYTVLEQDTFNDLSTRNPASVSSRIK